MHKIEKSLRESFSDTYITKKLQDRNHTMDTAIKCIEAYEQWAGCEVAEDEFFSCCLNEVKFNNGGLRPAVLEAFYVSWGLHNAEMGGCEGNEHSPDSLVGKRIPICPKCGASTWVDEHNPASDHPELLVYFDSCHECEWTSDDRTSEYPNASALAYSGEQRVVKTEVTE